MYQKIRVCFENNYEAMSQEPGAWGKKSGGGRTLKMVKSWAILALS